MRDRYVCVGFRTGLFIYFKHVSVYFVFIACLCVYVYATAWMWKPEGDLKELVLFSCVGPGNQAEVARRGQQVLLQAKLPHQPQYLFIF